MVSPAFFGYESAIIDEFRAQGHDAVFLDERPSNSPMARAVVRVFPALVKKQVERHFRQALKDLGDEPLDGVLVIKGEVTPEWFLTEISRRHPRAVFVYYTYDALSNSSQGKRILTHFHRKFSFDPADVAANPGFELKELFYAPDYTPSGGERDLDLSFVGTLHGDRYAFTQAVAASVPSGRQRLFYYMAARWYYTLRKLTSPEVRSVPRADISFVPLSRAEVVEIAQRSRTVIDLQRAGQTGLTMRTFEVLATGAAIITANDSIRDQEFFSDERVLIVPRDPAQVDAEEVRRFVARQPAVGSAPAGFEKHSLNAWVSEFVDAFRSDGDGHADRR
ncbi:hypothetical protein J2Y69_001838 [Microbacterium resistens]|uniref:Spore protein YkvP/CgeB glycosyl transferase-like domain-containing protein n=1 Tax=Microbacterium resistens TaxID=156977 RepID=A0ABU1SC99_9MICO|nr:hypothetical protein [Microbacterium resistens]MDR6867237.1 hypothetical protein [Microbacterium resistens]